MLLTLMVLCAVGAILLVGLGAFTELRDLWAHPEHREDVEASHHDNWHGHPHG
jgi:hypothetical protein